MELQCIYSFENGLDQIMVDFKTLPDIAMENEKNFIAFAKTPLTNPEENNLAKISACVMTKSKPPKWFMECWGKFYFKKGNLNTENK